MLNYYTPSIPINLVRGAPHRPKKTDLRTQYGKKRTFAPYAGAMSPLDFGAVAISPET